MEDITLKEAVIPEELSNYAQRLYYEIQGYKVLLMSILKCGEFKYNEDNYKLFMTEYQKTNMQFNILMEEIKATYGSEFMDMWHNVDVYIIFINNTVRFVERRNENSSCKQGKSCSENKI